MFRFFNELGYFGDGADVSSDSEYQRKSLKRAHKLNENMTNVSRWVKEQLEKGTIKPGGRLEGMGLSALSSCNIL
jgi:hypothetical protein